MDKELPETAHENEPVPRSEFERLMVALALDIKAMRETMLTREDLKEFATKKDLEGFVTKEDLKELKKEMKVLKKELTHEFKAAVEIITDEMRGAHKDEISALRDKGERHDERITVLEQRAGLRA